MSSKKTLEYVSPELIEYGFFGEIAEGASAQKQAGQGDDMEEVGPCFGVPGLE